MPPVINFMDLTEADDQLIINAITGQERGNAYYSFAQIKARIDLEIDGMENPQPRYPTRIYSYRYNNYLKFILNRNGDFDYGRCMVEDPPWRPHEFAALIEEIPDTMPGGHYAGEDHTRNTKPNWTIIAAALRVRLNDNFEYRYSQRNCGAAYRVRILPDFNANQGLANLALPAGTPPVIPGGAGAAERQVLIAALQQAGNRHYVDHPFVVNFGWLIETPTNIDIFGHQYLNFGFGMLIGEDESSASEDDISLHPEEDIIEF